MRPCQLQGKYLSQSSWLLWNYHVPPESVHQICTANNAALITKTKNSTQQIIIIQIVKLYNLLHFPALQQTCSFKVWSHSDVMMFCWWHFFMWYEFTGQSLPNLSFAMQQNAEFLHTSLCFRVSFICMHVNGSQKVCKQPFSVLFEHEEDSC